MDNGFLCFQSLKIIQYIVLGTKNYIQRRLDKTGIMSKVRLTSGEG